MAMGTGWKERFTGLFTQPAVPAAMVVLAAVIMVLGEIQSQPIRAQVARERNLQVQREVAVEKALSQYTETMRQDNEVERKSWEKRLLQKDDQMQGVMEQIAGWMKAEGWKGELKPRMEEGVTPELSDLRRIGLAIELVSPRSVSARLTESDQVRLLRILRKISAIPAPHVVRRLEVDQNLDGEMRARVELEFFRLKTDG